MVRLQGLVESTGSCSNIDVYCFACPVWHCSRLLSLQFIINQLSLKHELACGEYSL